MEKKKIAGGMGFWVCNLAFTMERFSFYSAKWLIAYFIVKSALEGGLGLSGTQEELAAAGAIASANLVAFTYLAPLIGSYISDRLVGARYLVPVGMCLMAMGYLVGWKATSLTGVNMMIVLVSIGTGLFKPQTNSITGRLFNEPGQLDAAFSTQYSMVNVGSFLGTTLIGIIATSEGYRFCFLICGIMMLVNAVWFVFGWRFLGEAGKKPFKIDEHTEKGKPEEKKKPLTSIQKKRIAAIILVSAFSAIFWVFWYLAYLPVYYYWDDPAKMNWFIGSFKIPSSWFDSENAFVCVALGPLLGMLWAKDAKRPGGGLSIFKHTALGIFILGLSFIVFSLADVLRGGQPASILWMILFGFLLTTGEMTFSPLGNSFISKFAPAKLLSAMMAVWTFSIFIAGKSYGWIYNITQKLPFAQVYFAIAAILIVSGVILWILDGKLNSLVIKDEK